MPDNIQAILNIIKATKEEGNNKKAITRLQAIIRICQAEIRKIKKSS